MKDAAPSARRDAAFVPFDALDPMDTRALMGLLARLDPRDAAELRAQRGGGAALWRIGAEIAAIHAGEAHIEAALIYPVGGDARPDEPIAYVGAWRAAPRLATVAFLGARGVRRYLPAIAATLGALRAEFGAKHGVALAEAKILASYGPALRWIARTGADFPHRLPGVGQGGEDFVQALWRL